MRIKRKYRRTPANHKRCTKPSARRRRNRRRGRSSLETTVQAWLKEDGIEFKSEYPIGRCHVDLFIAPRTVVELAGCYWHGCMICNRTLSQRHKIAQVKDARRFAFLSKKGFDVIVIWEHEVDNEPDRVRAVLQVLGKKKE